MARIFNSHLDTEIKSLSVQKAGIITDIPDYVGTSKNWVRIEITLFPTQGNGKEVGLPVLDSTKV